MIDATAVAAMLREEGLATWAEQVQAQLDTVLEDRPHGDWDRWQTALQSLPDLGGGRVDCADGLLSLVPDDPLGELGLQQLRAALTDLHPWRKGPYQVAGITIDTEWRSDWKWERVAPHIEPLDDRLVLDVGCGNGYHCWRLALAGARRVIGIDPTVLFLAQYLALRRLIVPMRADLAGRVEMLPLGIEALPGQLARFDTVLSMGVLYHRRSPIDHLLELRGALRKGGQLVLETLVVEGGVDRVLLPPTRYAKMRNVWFIPSTALLEVWLARAGFGDIQTVDVSVTTVEEQRSTDWMRFESLVDFLDPADSRFTIEGHPAPRRAILVARA